MTRPRGNRHRLRGVVVHDKAASTITVQVTRRFRHPRYGKMVRRNTRIAAHDEANTARVGDTVEIESCRPLSRTKRWRLVGVVERGPEGRLVTGVEDAAPPEPPPQPPAVEAPAEPSAVEAPAEPSAVEAPAEPSAVEAAPADAAPPEETPPAQPSDAGEADAEDIPAL
jgi:small subunit ribosomal protein S17